MLKETTKIEVGLIKKLNKMKKKNLLFLFVSGIVLLSSCGKDGMNGKSFLAIHDSEYSNEVCTRYWDDNDDIPYGFSYGTYYQTKPGTYNYEYDVSVYDSNTGVEVGTTTVSGNYTITINLGEKGGLLKDGKDGSDKHYDFYCDFAGADITHQLINSTKPIILPDTTIFYNGYQMIITRKIMPKDFTSTHKPKFQIIKKDL